MLTYKYLKKNSFGKYCQSCFNIMFDLDIKEYEYVFLHGYRRCERCGDRHHLVSGVVRGKRYKVWRGVKPVDKTTDK